MFNPEKLLFKVVSEMAGSADIFGGQKQRKKIKRKARGLSDSLLDNLTSGKGLMTAIALGVGAYTAATSTKTGTTAPHSHTPQPPPQSQTETPSTPPPLQTNGQSVTAPPPLPKTAEKDNLAVKLIQVMIAAAWADGAIDAEEESQILKKLQGQQLEAEEKSFLLEELHNPKSISELTNGIRDARIAQTMYSLAVATLVIDTEEERTWLDNLAQHLAISTEMQMFIEEEL